MSQKFHRDHVRHYMRAMDRSVSWSALALVGALIWMPTPSDALVFNNNVAPNTEAAAVIYDVNNQYSNVVSVNTITADGGGQCTGTLINSRTILTAAHCAWNAGTETFAQPSDIRLGFSPQGTSGTTANDQSASGVLVNSNYRDARSGNDIALISLSRPVTSITPVAVISPDAPTPSFGALGALAGYGQYGTGLDAGLYSAPGDPDEAPLDGLRRFGETRIGNYAVWNFDRQGDIPVIMAQFRNPGSPNDPDLYSLDQNGFPVPASQAGNGGGDSGGPLFLVMDDGSLVQIGILALLNPAPNGTLQYGVISGWEFIPNYSAWLAANNPLRNTSAVAGTFNWSNAAAWMDDQGFSEVPNNIDGSFEGPYGTLGRYYDVTLSAASQIKVDISPTIDSLTVSNPAALLDILPTSTLTTILDTQITAGGVAVNGTLAAQSLFLQGGFLSGTGSIVAAGGVIHTGGTIAPGSVGSLGTLSIIGNYYAAQGADTTPTLSVRLGTGASDHLAVSGTANIAGTLDYTLFSAVPFGSTYTVLTAGGGLFGGFSAISGPTSAFTAAQASYDDNNAYLSIVKTRSFASAGTTANQIATGAAIDSMAAANPLVVAATWLPTLGQAALAFDQLSGQAYASLETVLLQDSRFGREVAVDRLRSAFGTVGAPAMAVMTYADDGTKLAKPAPGTGTAVWMRGFGSFGDVSATAANAALSRTIGGFYGGIDREVLDGWRLGVLGGFSQTSVSADALFSSFSSDNYTLGFYGGRQWGALALRLGGTYTWHELSTARTVVFPGFANTLEAGFGANTAQVFGELGYQARLAGIDVEPFANLAYVTLDSNSIQEAGGAAGLWSSGLGGSVTYSTLGLRASAPVFAKDDATVSARATLAWQHAWNGSVPDIAMSFAGSQPFVVAGAPLAQDTALVEAGLDTMMANNITLGVSYSGQFGDGLSDNGFQATLTVKF